MAANTVAQNPPAVNDETVCVLEWLSTDPQLHKAAHIITKLGGSDALIEWVCECAVPNLGNTLGGDLLGRALGEVDFRHIAGALVEAGIAASR